MKNHLENTDSENRNLSSIWGVECVCIQNHPSTFASIIIKLSIQLHDYIINNNIRQDGQNDRGPKWHAVITVFDSLIIISYLKGAIILLTKIMNIMVLTEV